MPAPTMQTSQRSTADGSDPDMKLIIWRRRGSAYSDTRFRHVLICGVHGIDAIAAVANTGVVRSVVVLGYPGVQALDLVGPSEVFTGATIYLASQGRVDEGYSVTVVSRNGEPATTLTGLALIAPPSADPREPIDTLLLPGVVGVDEARCNADTIGWIQIAAEHARRVVSVCTGSFLAAQAGFVDGCVATTHWAFAGQMAREFPSVTVDPEPIFVRSSEKVWTAAGVTAGIDLALSLVEDDYGTDAAQTVVRWLVLYLRRPGGQTQFRGAGVDAARQASADPRRAGGHRVRTRWRAQYPGV